jgi:hypothetical protein
MDLFSDDTSVMAVLGYVDGIWRIDFLFKWKVLGCILHGVASRHG